MRVHLVGICGTGMGALAMLFRERGDDVSGSDASFDPPIGPALLAAGIRTMQGYDPAHLDPAPDVVVVGNAIRRENPMATSIRERGLPAVSMSGALREYFLAGRTPLLVAGTHGKTTTSSIAAYLLHAAGLEPGYFIGGLPKDLPSGAAVGSKRRKLVGASASPAPFVVEADEYDAVYSHKQPKFLDYIGVSSQDVVILTSIEHDHIDIYESEEKYVEAFRGLVDRTPEGGLLVADASYPAVRELARSCKASVRFYALEGDDVGDVVPTWQAALVPMAGEPIQKFDLFGAGTSFGRFELRIPGAHNVRNAVAAFAAVTEGFGVDVVAARRALAQFGGVRRRQDLLGTPGGISVYDDFAHHPTAVRETLSALRARHKSGRLFAVFEPRSATACRAIHQADYVGAFGGADRVLFAPLGRTNVPEAERLDLSRLAREIGPSAVALESVDAILETLGKETRPGDVVALLSNGAFGGIHGRLLAALAG